jgi:hypothetical protein
MTIAERRALIDGKLDRTVNDKSDEITFTIPKRKAGKRAQS